MLNPAAPSFVPSSPENPPLKRGPYYFNMTTNPRLMQKKGWHPLIHPMFTAQEEAESSAARPYFGEPGEFFWFKNWTPSNPVHILGQLSREAPSGPGRHMMIFVDYEVLRELFDRYKVRMPRGYRAFLAITSRPRGLALKLGEGRPNLPDSEIFSYEKTSSLYQYVPSPGLPADQMQGICWGVLTLEHNTFVSLNIYLISEMEMEPLRSGIRAKLDAQSYRDAYSYMLLESVKPRFRSETIYPN